MFFQGLGHLKFYRSNNTRVLPSMIVPLKNTRCSKRNCCISSCDEKLISRETARHLSIRFGTRASCSTPGVDLYIKQ